MRPLGPVVKSFKPDVVAVETAGRSEREAEHIEECYSFSEVPFFSIATRFEHAILKRHRLNQRVIGLERFNDEKSVEVEEIRSEGVSSYNAAVNLFVEGKPKEALVHYMNYLRLFTKYHSERENEAKRNLETLHETIVKRFPDLEAKRKIKVLVHYGTFHTGIYLRAVRAGFGNVRRVIKTPVYFLPRDVVAKRATLGLPSQQLTEEQVARAFAAEIFMREALSTGTRSFNAFAAANLLAKKINFEKFERISKGLIAQNATSQMDLSKKFRELAKREGIIVPNSKSEVHQLLRRNRIKLGRN